MKRALRISFISGLSLVVVVGLVIGLVLSPWGGRLILREARQELAKRFQTELDYSQGQLDLLSGFDFKDLHLRIKRPGLDADIKIRELRLRYKFSILNRAVEVEGLEVKAPRIEVRTDPAAAPPPEVTKPEKPGASGSGSRSGLSHPPLKFDLKDAVIDPLDVDFEQTGESEIKLHVHGARLRMDLHVRAGELQTGGEISFGEGDRLTQATKTALLERSLRADFGGGGKWSVCLSEKEGQPLKFELNSSAMEFYLANLEFAQRQGLAKQRVTLARLDAELKSSLVDQFSAALATRIKRLDMPGTLAHPSDFQWLTEIKAPRAANEMDVESTVELAGLKLLRLTTHAEREAKVTHFKGEMNFATPPEIASLLPSVTALKQNPHLAVKLDFDGEVDTDYSAKVNARLALPRFFLSGQKNPLALELDEKSNWSAPKEKLETQLELSLRHRDFGDWAVKSQFDWERLKAEAESLSFLSSGETELQRLKAGTKPLPVEWSGPITVHHQVKQPADGATDAHVAVNLPELNARGVARFAGTKLNVDVKPHADHGHGLEIEAHLEQARIDLAPRPGLKMAPLAGLRFDVNGSLRDHRQLTLSKISAAVDHGLFAFEAEATGNLVTRDFQLHGNLQSQIPADFPELNGQHIQGQVGMPISLIVFRGRELAITSDVSFKDFSWKSGDKAIQQMNGHIPIEEKLYWKAPHVSFVDLIDENPFERVDFNRVRPLLSGNEQLRVEHVQWREKSYGPFIGFFSLSQNMISVHQFDMDIGGGRAYGELFFNIHPANLQMGFLGRLTNLNLTDFLPGDFLKGEDKKARDLSARAGLVCNLNRATIDGRLDVTEIGGRQLNALINTLDPTFRDEKMNKIRTMLRVGYPVGVNLAFAEGFMDMDVDLNILSVVTRQSVHSIPMSGFIAKATQGLVQQNSKGVLQ